MSEQPVGAEIAGYRIESVIGRGGMAVVYRAEDTRLGRKVALKLLTSALSDQEQFKQRFIQESRLAASLDHPNIIPIYEAGNADGLLFIAMRYVVGSDLKQALAGQAGLSAPRTLRLCEQIGDALDAAHALGLVHRDVKPGNVLLTSFHEQTDHVYLTDFGLTKRASSLTGGLTGTGHFLGTIDYVAPEQIAGKAVDARTDIYALGCVLYECLTGRVPFHRDDDAATLWAHLVDMPPPVSATRSDLGPAVDEVISRAMAKSPDERYGSCHELVQALRSALELAAPVRGGRGLGGVDTSPPSGRAALEDSQQTRAPAEHPSFPPGSFPPGPPPAGIRQPAHRAYEPEPDDADDADEQEYSDSLAAPPDEQAEPRPDGDWGDDDGAWVGEAAGEGDWDGEDEGYPPAESGSTGVRALLRRRRWLLAAALLVLLGLGGFAANRLFAGSGQVKLTGQYTSAQQFTGLAQFSLATPADWGAVNDPADVDVTLSPGGQNMANLFTQGGQPASWVSVKTLLNSNRSKAVGAWISAWQSTPDSSTWRNLQNAVQSRLPAAVAFDSGYQQRTVGGMFAFEMTGRFKDPADSGTALQFVIDVIDDKATTSRSSVWVVFFAAPDKFNGQQQLFERVRNSIAFQ